MPQIFSRRANVLARVSIAAVLLLLLAAGWAVNATFRSPYLTRVGVPLEQPVPFSHQHHVGDAGIDCRYCHTSVETSAFAGLPSVETCLSCHSKIFSDAPMLAPVRESFRTGVPLRWTRVHDLPDFVYFDHSIHVQKGVGCSTCHGRVDRMPITWKAQALEMRWCLECHEQPEKFLRPQAEIFNLAWQPPANQAERGAQLVHDFRVNKVQLMDCSICHR